MATKPTIADTVPVWPSNAIFTAGPSIGQPTSIDPTPYAANGHIEGVSNPTDCRVQNGWQLRAGKWCNWVESGSFTGAADSHIVETAATGKTKLQALDILGTTPVSGPALHVKFGSLGSEVALFEHGDTNAAVVSVGGPTADQYGVWAQTVSKPAFRATSVGFQPIELGVQFLTLPATPGPDSGAMWFPREGSVTNFRVANGNRTHVVSYVNQFVRIISVDAATTVLSAVTPSYQSLIGATALPASNGVIAGMNLIATITFNCTTNGNPSQELTVRLSNLGTPIFSTLVHMDTNIEDVKVIKQFFVVLPGTQSFELFINKSNGGGSISISNLIMEIQTLG